MEWILKHKFIAVIVAFAIAAIGWYLLSGSSAPVLTTTPALGDTPPGAQQLVQSLLQLRTITLDTSIFSNPAYTSLQDFTSPLVPEPVGRTDPFASIQVSSQVSAASSTQTAKIFAPHAAH